MTKLQYVLGQRRITHAKNQVTTLLEPKIKLTPLPPDGFNISVSKSNGDILRL